MEMKFSPLKNIHVFESRLGWTHVLPAAEGEVKVVPIQSEHTKQYGGQNEPRVFIVFPITHRDETKNV